VVHYGRSAREAMEVVAAVERQSRRAVALEADLADREQIAGLIARAADALGSLDLLVNNAAVFGFDRPGIVHRESWDRHMDVNLWAPIALTRQSRRRARATRAGQRDRARPRAAA
jgi:NAD(P)-dependent dehydrogenase (short-subunit alcohol dehydrogenase family)